MYANSKNFSLTDKNVRVGFEVLVLQKTLKCWGRETYDRSSLQYFVLKQATLLQMPDCNVWQIMHLRLQVHDIQMVGDYRKSRNVSQVFLWYVVEIGHCLSSTFQDFLVFNTTSRPARRVLFYIPKLNKLAHSPSPATTIKQQPPKIEMFCWTNFQDLPVF